MGRRSAGYGVQGGAALPLAGRVGLTAGYRLTGFSLGDRLGAQTRRRRRAIARADSRDRRRVLSRPSVPPGLRSRGYAPRAVPNHLLSPEEVLARYSAGPKSGVFTDGSCEGNPGPGGWGVVWVEDDAIRAEQLGPRSRHHQQPHGARRADRRLRAPARRRRRHDVLRQPDLREDGERVGQGLGAARLAAQGRRDREPRAGAAPVAARERAPEGRSCAGSAPTTARSGTNTPTRSRTATCAARDTHTPPAPPGSGLTTCFGYLPRRVVGAGRDERVDRGARRHRRLRPPSGAAPRRRRLPRPRTGAKARGGGGWPRLAEPSSLRPTSSMRRPCKRDSPAATSRSTSPLRFRVRAERVTSRRTTSSAARARRSSRARAALRVSRGSSSRASRWSTPAAEMRGRTRRPFTPWNSRSPRLRSRPRARWKPRSSSRSLDWLILRGALFYGPGTDFDDDWFARARAGKLRLPGEGDDYVSLVHIADMAGATIAALRRWPSRQALIVADDQPARWRDAVQLRVRRRGRRSSAARRPRPACPRFASPIGARGNCSRGRHSTPTIEPVWCGEEDARSQ